MMEDSGGWGSTREPRAVVEVSGRGGQQEPWPIVEVSRALQQYWSMHSTMVGLHAKATMGD